MSKPKAGLLFVTSNWFRQVGVQDENGGLSEEVENIGREAAGRIAPYADMTYDGVLFSEEAAQKAALDIAMRHVSILIVSSLMWCEDQVLRAALKELPDIPIILLTLLPSATSPDYLSYAEMLKGSGTVGSLQFSGMLKREGRRYISLSGYYRDDSLYKELGGHLKALGVKERLASLKVGVLPFPCAQMSTTYVDEFTLRTSYGVELRYLELSRLKTLAKEIPHEETAAFRKNLGEAGCVVKVEEKELDWNIRLALGLHKMCASENISVLAMNDVIAEMHHTLGLRPSLYNPEFSAGDTVVSMEADIAAGLGLYILKLISGKPALYTEVLGVYVGENALLLGHAGYHDARNADESLPVTVVPDVEYKTTDRNKGACTCFKMKPGQVTLVNAVFHDKTIKLTAVLGESLPGPIKLEDTTHLMCRLTVPVLDFIDRAVESGVSQHWLAVPGDYLDDLRVLSLWLPAELDILV